YSHFQRTNTRYSTGIYLGIGNVAAAACAGDCREALVEWLLGSRDKPGEDGLREIDPDPKRADREEHMAAPGKIAVITGAGSGIGRASAHALLEAGWNVVLAGRRRDMLEETASLAGVMPPRVLAVPTDIRDPTQIAGLFAG